VRVLRIDKGLSTKELARITKVDERALLRLEHGDSLPTENSYTLNAVLVTLECNKKQKRAIKSFVRDYKVIE
jgi:transcriptional regulator with XRE-family HTH domain